MINHEGQREKTAAIWLSQSLPSRRVTEKILSILEALPECHFPI